MISHEFLTIDEGHATLLHIAEDDQSKNWLVPIGRPQARDMQLVGNDLILIGTAQGYSEFSIAQGRLIKEIAHYTGVTSVRRQANGHTLLAGVKLAGAAGVCVLELDAADKEVNRTDFEGDYVRLIRQTAQGTYLFCCNDRIREASNGGTYLRDYPVEGFYHAWKAVRLANGHLLVSAGYGAFGVELAEDGSELRRFGGKSESPIRPFFFAMFQLLSDGNVVVANWQGHGPGHGTSGAQLLEYDPTGKVVWTWSKPDLISSLQGVLILDGVDRSLLHDERTGILSPV